MRSFETRRAGAHGLGLTAAAALLLAALGHAQGPTYGVGRPPTPAEIKALDISITPGGAELPDGRGTAEAGKALYATHCARCHGATGKEGPQDVLAGGVGSLASPKPLKTVGSYWPYATTLFDYVNRAMPFDRPATMSADEVYASVAYVLFLNGLVGERDVIDARTLPQVKMPNRDGFVVDPRPDVGLPKAPPTTPKRAKPGGR
jgi:S-disulfanyl-L-cysteine oxidoreductase SoxD